MDPLMYGIKLTEELDNLEPESPDASRIQKPVEKLDRPSWYKKLLALTLQQMDPQSQGTPQRDPARQQQQALQPYDNLIGRAIGRFVMPFMGGG